MIEHAEWIGDGYKNGIMGSRIAIVGYSHHTDESYPDCNHCTIDTVRQVISGKQVGDSFFPAVRGYFAAACPNFGFDDKATFWNQVLFFNFLPECVSDDEPYAWGTDEQNKRGKQRFQRIITDAKPKPDKILVFTMKGWQELPGTREEEVNKNSPRLGAEFPRFEWGTYDAGGHIALAFGLRHPLGAPRQMMIRAVQTVLGFQLGNEVA